LLVKVCDFAKFGRHVVLFTAASDLSSALIFDVIACFEGVVHIENHGFVWRFNKNIDYFSASNSLINVSLDRFNRDILQTEIFYITELLTEVNQELPGHVHAGVRKACAELNNYMLRLLPNLVRLLPCVDPALVGLSDSICMNIDAAFAFSNDLSVYATSVCSCMRAIR
jgi:hypothetical protein